MRLPFPPPMKLQEFFNAYVLAIVVTVALPLAFFLMQLIALSFLWCCPVANRASVIMCLESKESMQGVCSVPVRRFWASHLGQ